jgi:hypothetical protein
MRNLKIWLKKEMDFEAPEKLIPVDYELMVDVELIEEVVKDGIDALLENVYKHAQNTDEMGWVARFTGMKVPTRSLSVGDVIEFNGKFYAVDSFGFTEIENG